LDHLAGAYAAFPWITLIHREVSIHVITKKRRGRPATTGKGTLIGVRLLDDPLATLDAWIAKQGEPELSRPEAIRRLVELGLKSKK
jgi:hypothetical protein